MTFFFRKSKSLLKISTPRSVLMTMAGNKPTIKKTKKLKSPTNVVEYFFEFDTFFPLEITVFVVFKLQLIELLNSNVRQRLYKINEVLLNK